MYKQITDQVKEAIANGSLAPGIRLPSIRELSRELKVSTITIKRAYSDLENEGYIITRIGLGSFVAGMSRDKLRQQKIDEIRKEIEKIVVTAEKIGISARDVGDIVGEIGKENNKKEACNDTV
jgi:GntR family transcriptional regulator